MFYFDPNTGVPSVIEDPQQAERRKFWCEVFTSCPDLHIVTASSMADAALSEYDKRFTGIGKCHDAWHQNDLRTVTHCPTCGWDE